MIKFNIVAALAVSVAVTSTHAIHMKSMALQVPTEETTTPVTEVGSEDYESSSDDMVLLRKEVEIKEIDVSDGSGQEARLIIYKGLLEQPVWYQEFGRAGYLSNEEGDLIDLEGKVLISKEELVDLIFKEKRGEPVDMKEAIKVMDINDEGDETPEDLVGMPAVEIEEGTADYCCQGSGACFCSCKPQFPQFKCCKPQFSGCKPQFSCCKPKFDCCQPKFDCCQPKFDCCQPKFDCCKPKFDCCQPKFDCCVPQCTSCDCCQPKCECCVPKCSCSCCQPTCGPITRTVCKGQVKTICKKKPYVVQVPVARPKPVPYIVEVPVRVPVTKTVRVPIHVPVKVPVKCPVYVKEYVPNYIQKIIPVEQKVCKTFTNVINIEKPIVKTCVKRVQIQCPIYKKQIVPIYQKCYVKKPYPVHVKEYYPVTKTVNKYVKCPVVEKKYYPVTEVKKVQVCKPTCCNCCQPSCCKPTCSCFKPNCCFESCKPTCCSCNTCF